jgi:site-specific DNA-methyltransferase (adenine-specific)
MLGDCLERMKEIPDGSVDLILTDPPYGTIKGMKLKGWDNSTTKWDDAIDNNKMWHEINRVLRVNGCCILFAQDPYTSVLMNDCHNNVPFSYRLVWDKKHYASPLGANKFPVNYFEDVCVFFKKHDSLALHPLRHYFADVLEFIGKNLKQVNTELGHRRAEHCFYIDSTQFGLCIEATYNELIERYSINKMQGFMSYAELKAVDDEHKKTVARVFNLHDGKKYKSNILEYKKDYNGYHPTQKPVALLEDLIQTYSNEGNTVLDFTMGSGSTGVAAKNLNRKFIGIEKDAGYFEIAKQRLGA